MSRAIRFQPDPLDHALIDFSVGNKEFTPTAVGLILNESYTGCALVIKALTIEENELIRIQVGRLSPMPAKIVWVKVMDESLLKVGIQFIE